MTVKDCKKIDKLAVKQGNMMQQRVDYLNAINKNLENEKFELETKLAELQNQLTQQKRRNSTLKPPTK